MCTSINKSYTSLDLNVDVLENIKIYIGWYS